MHLIKSMVRGGHERIQSFSPVSQSRVLVAQQPLGYDSGCLE